VRRLTAIVLVAVAAVLAGDRARALLDRGGEGLKVVRVVDGDTIHVRAGGREETVRYIGVDTPETVKPDTPVQCFGKAASAYNRSLVDGERVRLVADAEARDRFGRRLAYVYRVRDGLFVNAALVRGGYATTLTIPPNVTHADELRRLARQARRAGRGLWSACAGSR
jgi:micrococcal nuclease